MCRLAQLSKGMEMTDRAMTDAERQRRRRAKLRSKEGFAVKYQRAGNALNAFVLALEDLAKQYARLGSSSLGNSERKLFDDEGFRALAALGRIEGWVDELVESENSPLAPTAIWQWVQRRMRLQKS
jgi:hypothetical protein